MAIRISRAGVPARKRKPHTKKAAGIATPGWQNNHPVAGGNGSTIHPDRVTRYKARSTPQMLEDKVRKLQESTRRIIVSSTKAGQSARFAIKDAKELVARSTGIIQAAKELRKKAG